MNWQIIEDQLLAQTSTEKYQAFQSTLIPTAAPIKGVRTPDMRAFGKKLIGTLTNQEIIELIQTIPNHHSYELDFMKGILIGGLKEKWPVKWPLLVNYAHELDNWATCDSFGMKVKLKEAEKELLLPNVVALIHAKSEFVTRLGLIILAANYVNPTYIDRIFKLLDELTYGDYYIEMAAAWLLADCFIKVREQTLPYLMNDTMIPFSVFKKAVQKMRDSYRVTDQDKELLNVLKEQRKENANA